MDLQEIICALGSDGMLSQAAAALQQGASLADTLRAAGLEESRQINDALDSLRHMEAEDAERRRQEAAYFDALKQTEQAAAASRARFDELEAMLRETHSMVSALYARLMPEEG